MENVVKYEVNGIPFEISKETIKKYLKVDANDMEFMQFASLCRQHKLNPWSREAYIMKGDREDAKAAIIIGKEGYLRMAASNPDYDGMQDGVLYEINGEIVKYKDDNTGKTLPGGPGTFVPEGAKLVGGWAIVYSKRRSYPKLVTVNLKDYQKLGKNSKTGVVEPIGSWKQMPAIMINKIAKCTALREMFPETFDGTYGEEEIDKNGLNFQSQNNNGVQNTITQTKAETKCVVNPETGEVTEEPVMPTLAEALEYTITNAKYKSLVGHKLKQLVESKAKDPMPYLQALAKLEGDDGMNAKVVVDAIEKKEIEIKFVEGKKE